jgi:hypothetical protein
LRKKRNNPFSTLEVSVGNADNSRCEGSARKPKREANLVFLELSDPTFILPPVQLTRREVFSFSIARKLLERFEGTSLEMDMRSVLAKIAGSLEGTVSLNVESLTEQFTVLSEGPCAGEP